MKKRSHPIGWDLFFMPKNDRDEGLRELQSLLCNYANARAKTK
jgi:hypothetical protein